MSFEVICDSLSACEILLTVYKSWHVDLDPIFVSDLNFSY